MSVMKKLQASIRMGERGRENALARERERERFLETGRAHSSLSA